MSKPSLSQDLLDREVIVPESVLKMRKLTLWVDECPAIQLLCGKQHLAPHLWALGTLISNITPSRNNVYTQQVSVPYFPVVLGTLITVTMFHRTGTKITIISHSIPHLD